MTDLYYPLRSLREGHWFKLICGASFQHLPAIRNLVIAYTLAGADCIDVAADPAVVSTAKAALKLAAALAQTDKLEQSYMQGLPWLMVSLNDGEDPHFRKAEFDATTCPPSCTRPCELICPAQAIVFKAATKAGYPSEQALALQSSAYKSSIATNESISGVLSDRCYGCGRCLPICPVQQIETRSYLVSPAIVLPLVMQAGIDAIEIHTQIGHMDEFRRLWVAIEPWVCKLKLVAISCPDGDDLLDYLRALYDIISPLPCPLLWQLDGRPMSGDIGMGATRSAIKLGQKVLRNGLPGYLQLAGGTNHHTVPKLNALNLLHPQLCKPSTTLPTIASNQQSESTNSLCASAPLPETTYIAGVAYGSYARTLLTPICNQLDAIDLQRIEPEPNATTPMSPQSPSTTANLSRQTAPLPGEQLPLRLEEVPDLLGQAVALARSLVSQLKGFNDSHRTRLNL